MHSSRIDASISSSAPVAPFESSLFHDLLTCLASCSLGGFAGLAIGIVLGWGASGMAVLALAMATGSSVAVMDCPMVRRGSHFWKQFG